MRDVLIRLGTYPGVLGCLVATSDGIVVESHLEDMDQDAAAALVSSLLVHTADLLDSDGGARMDQLELRASRGKIIVSDLGSAYLVVVTDRGLDLDQGRIEIKSAAKALRRMGQIHV